MANVTFKERQHVNLLVAFMPAFTNLYVLCPFLEPSPGAKGAKDNVQNVNEADDGNLGCPDLDFRDER